MKERKPIIERDGESKKLYGKRRHEKRERNSGERERESISVKKIHYCENFGRDFM